MIIELYEFFRVIVSNDIVTPSDLLLFTNEIKLHINNIKVFILSISTMKL